jgi:hypothetical protein
MWPAAKNNKNKMRQLSIKGQQGPWYATVKWEDGSSEVLPCIHDAFCRKDTTYVRDHAVILPDDATPKPDGIFGKDRFSVHTGSENSRVKGLPRIGFLARDLRDGVR